MIEGKSGAKILGLVITDGLGYRNFILSRFMEESRKHFNCIIIFSYLPGSHYKGLVGDGVEVVELPEFKESCSTWVFRRAKEVAHLHLHKNKIGISHNLEKNKYNKPAGGREWVLRFIYLLTARFHRTGIIQFYFLQQLQALKRQGAVEEYSQILKEFPCNFLFFSQQRPPMVAPFSYAAKKMNIPTGSFIFSWDNLLSKGRMGTDFDYYFVWSKQMKQDLLIFYPEVSKNRIKVVGSPQFELYSMKEYRMQRSVFFRKFRLNPELKTICYSCGDASTSKNDAYYIKLLVRILRKNKLERKVNFLVRTAPVEDGSRFAELVQEYPFIRWNFPQWQVIRKTHPEPWSQRVPTQEDLQDLNAILSFSDVGINMCSTMSLDFLLFDKPVINTVMGNGSNDLYNDRKYLEFDHYKRVVVSSAVTIALNEQQLHAAISQAIKNPSARLQEGRDLVKRVLGDSIEHTCKRMLRELRILSD